MNPFTNENTAYLLNSTPKYYYILELHVLLLQRYGNKWDVYFATEEPDHPICKLLKEQYGVELLVLEKKNSSFLASRKRALELLPSKYEYVLPMQEDFLLERPIDEEAIKEAGFILYLDAPCVRLMPCPGPDISNMNYRSSWKHIKNDTYKFCFQATLWRTEDCLLWYTAIVKEVEKYTFATEAEKTLFEIRKNIAENEFGQELFAKLFAGRPLLGYTRKYKAANAVYSSPWPYRPTAIVKGILQPFAKELAEREGLRLIP